MALDLEAALLGSGMGQGDAGRAYHQPPVGDEVEIEGSRSVGLAPDAPKGGLQADEEGQQRARRQSCFYKGDAIDKAGLGGIGPGGGRPPGGSGDDSHAGGGESGHGRFHQILARGERTLSIGAQGDDPRRFEVEGHGPL